METLEDFRTSLTSADPPAQPILPPALQSMEAFKTRRSFLNGQLGFETPYTADTSEESEDGTGDEIAWMQASDLSDLCVADMTNAPPLLRQFCERVHSERAALQQGHDAQARPQPQVPQAQQAAQTVASSAEHGDGTDEEGDIF